MKTTNHILIITTIPFLLTACAGTNSLSTLGAGSDTASLAGKRGRSDALISKGQEDQIDRQQRVVRSEMDLEEAKRQNMMRGVTDVLGTARSIAGFFGR